MGARWTGKGRALRAGLYELPAGASPRDLLLAVTSGDAVQVKVTVTDMHAKNPLLLEMSFILCESFNLDMQPE